MSAKGKHPKLEETNSILSFLFNEVFCLRLNKLFVLIYNLDEHNNKETASYTS